QSDALEPSKKGLPCSTGERSAPSGLDLARSLPDEHHPRATREGHDRRDVNAQTTTLARRQAAAMALESAIKVSLPNGHANRYGGRWMPTSVTIAVTRSAGVTSNAGL